MEDALWSDCIPLDILGLISSHLVAAKYFVFRAVCKKWCYASVTPLHRPAQPEKSPRLITLRGNTGIVNFFHSVYNVITTTSIPIPKLMDSQIRSSKGNCNDIIELPDLQKEYENICASWTFSCPPDSSSSDCFVVGFDYLGNPPDVCIIKVGETNWTFHNLNNPADRYKCFYLTGCNSPIFFKNNIVYVLGDKGNLGILTINENSIPSWKFYGKSFLQDVDNEGMLAVFLSHHEGKVEVWRYKMNGEVLEREKNNNSDGSCLKTCVVHGLGKKIYFSMFHNNKGVFYCLVNHKYYSFHYLASKLIQVQIFSNWLDQHPAFGSKQRMINSIVPFLLAMLS
ncbi:hypothetical protein R3W88_023778 [Solanum pinnatisectum]|uniref:F-box domain-containing protein n=1 Tax=Solanum pinnatisectum TaxID=50273 RepID=A0AAV9M1Q3_9SOLN|nr:hypothetical protein R3W88_023778 [Solanum pinnatisectum]